MQKVQFLLIILALVAVPLGAQTGTLYTDFVSFNSAVSGLEEFCEVWSHSGYDIGTLTDAEMTSVRNEIVYEATTQGMPDLHFVSPENFYCTGNNCSGSFWLDFSSTSVTTPGSILDGVYAFSIILTQNEGDRWLSVRYENLTADGNILIPDGAFIGYIGDNLLLNAFHVGLQFGGSSGDDDGGAVQIGELCLYKEPPLFVDGFETGDTSAWTATLPEYCDGALETRALYCDDPACTCTEYYDEGAVCRDFHVLCQ